MNKVIITWKLIIYILLIFFVVSPTEAEQGAKLTRQGQGVLSAEEIKFQLHVKADVFPYVQVTITNPELTWEIFGGTGTAEAPATEIRVEGNSAFDIKISSVDDLTNQGLDSDPTTGANIIKVWYTLSDTKTDNPFKTRLLPNRYIITPESGSFSPPGYGTLECVPKQDTPVIRYLWSKIQVELNDKAGVYKDEDGFWITVSAHLK
jgi:hypothetical protein